jgi:hypothetical protein
MQRVADAWYGVTCGRVARQPARHKRAAVRRQVKHRPEELRKHLNEAELVELTAAIAQENFRARFNRPFKVEAVGFSHGGYCPLPEHLEPPPQSSA